MKSNNNPIIGMKTRKMISIFERIFNFEWSQGIILRVVYLMLADFLLVLGLLFF